MLSGRHLLCCSATLCGGLTLAACGGSTGTGTPATAASRAAAAARASAAKPAGTASGACSATHAPTPRGSQQISKPKLHLDPAKRYVVTLATNCGPISIQLDVAAAPHTTASFAYLVKRGFYDDLTFHRVAAGFVIQGGDPNGDGSGGPGYTVVEPPPSDIHYTLGTVAMAKTGTDPAGASGSQFFIVTAPEATLPPQYALLGHVVGGMTAVQAIARLPTDPPQDGAPTSPVVIRRASLLVG
jgi:peptidyl-prolyl cis-trans isomerase B (cyclophilin B)